MTEHEFNLKSCPLCGSEPEITLATEGPAYSRIVIECCSCGLVLDHTQHYYTTDRYDEKTNVRTIERIGSADSESSIELWNRRTPELGNEEPLSWEDMFPKCKVCASRPSEHSNIFCMCNEGMCFPKHPQGDHFQFQLGSYEGDA